MSDDRYDIVYRRSKILELIVNDEIRQATLQLLDFTRDFSQDKNLEGEALIVCAVSAEYEKIKSKSASAELTIKKTEIILRVWNILTSVTDAYKNDDWYASTKIGTVVKAEDISFSYSRGGKNNFELSNINLDLKFGKITGVVGENGNGKTTLLKIIAGVLKQEAGNVRYPALFDQIPYSYKKLKQQIAYIPQRLQVWNGSVKDNLHFMASIKGIRGKENIREVRYIISRLGLTEYENSQWDELSAGYQMRFELANMLVWKPKLLILDEPLANLDIKSQIMFLRSLREITRQIRDPLAVLVSSQHLLMIEKVADNIIFLKNGKARFNGPITDVGALRKENVFEVECSISIQALKSALQDSSILDIKSDGFFYYIHTGLNVTYLDISKKFITAGIPVKLLRDISKSVKSLFEV